MCKSLHISDKEVMGLDRISSLPDELMINIVSLLDTKYAIRTAVLSKRWQFIWMWFPSLRVNEEEFRAALMRGNMLGALEGEKELRNRFISAVDAVLMSHVGPVLEVFDVSFLDRFDGGQEQDDLNRWLHYMTVTKKVKRFCIRFPDTGGTYPEELSFHLFPCGSLTHLELVGRSFQSFSSCKDFTSIETLFLDGDMISFESITSFFTSCPSLWSYTIENCSLNDNISFSAPWLKVLKLSLMDEYNLKIHAPNLEYLRIESLEELRVLRLLGMQSLTILELVASYGHSNLPVAILADLRCLKKLRIPSHYLKFFYERIAGNQRRVVDQLDSLEDLVIDYLKASDMDTLASLLDAIPKVQKVTLNYPLWRDSDFYLRSIYEDLACGSLKNVKQIEMEGFFRMEYLPLVEFLLKKASVLESLRIKMWCMSKSDVSRKFDFAVKLLALPRGGTPTVHFSCL